MEGKPLGADGDLRTGQGRKRGERTGERDSIHRHAAREYRGREEPGDQVEDGKVGKRRDER